jgi:hypothetical protein
MGGAPPRRRRYRSAETRRTCSAIISAPSSVLQCAPANGRSTLCRSNVPAVDQREIGPAMNAHPSKTGADLRGPFGLGRFLRHLSRARTAPAFMLLITGAFGFVLGVEWESRVVEQKDAISERQVLAPLADEADRISFSLGQVVHNNDAHRPCYERFANASIQSKVWQSIATSDRGQYIDPKLFSKMQQDYTFLTHVRSPGYVFGLSESECELFIGRLANAHEALRRALHDRVARLGGKIDRLAKFQHKWIVQIAQALLILWIISLLLAPASRLVELAKRSITHRRSAKPG